jgi:ribosomal protein S18 acetylase RimI-like enzyme
MRHARVGSQAAPSGLRLRALGRDDESMVLDFLDCNPVRDVLIASRILNDGALGAAAWSPLRGAFDGRDRLHGVLHVGPNVVPAVDDPAVCDALAAAASAPGSTRMLVGERVAVERLWRLIADGYPRPREVRDTQYVYALAPGQLAVDPGRGPGRRGRARLADRADEDAVLNLSAAMYREEMGEDPLARDPAGYRRRIRVLTQREWTYVYELDGRLAFKMDVGCASEHTAQIQGVYVPPELRGRGVATAAMAACCVLALRRHPTLSLYVNDFNTAAVALYDRLGFRREPYDFQTILLP